MEQQSKGARAALELKLLFAQLDLARLERRKADLQRASEAWARTMPLPGQTKLQCLALSADCGLKAFMLGGQIEPLKLAIRNLESQLKSAPAETVVLTDEQMAAADDMAGIAA